MKPNLMKKQKFLVMGIIIIALLGVLVINTDRVSAERDVLNGSASQETAVEQSVTKAENSLGEGALPSILKLLSAMVLVVAAIYGALFILKKMMGKKYTGNGSGRVLEVLETTYLGPKKTVSLIRVADKSVLIGSTEDNISVLTELDEDNTSKILDSLVKEETESPFVNIFKTTIGKLKEMPVKRNGQELAETN